MWEGHQFCQPVGIGIYFAMVYRQADRQISRQANRLVDKQAMPQ